MWTCGNWTLQTARLIHSESYKSHNQWHTHSSCELKLHISLTNFLIKVKIEVKNQVILNVSLWKVDLTSQTADPSCELSVLPVAVWSNFSSRKGSDQEVVEGQPQGIYKQKRFYSIPSYENLQCCKEFMSWWQCKLSGRRLEGKDFLILVSLSTMKKRGPGSKGMKRLTQDAVCLSSRPLSARWWLSDGRIK